uniref:HD domain-containing protein n=1 Tax=Oryzias melastigma TaxID=30732 RepID=A0A3B3C1U8_ORYME
MQITSGYDEISRTYASVTVAGTTVKQRGYWIWDMQITSSYDERSRTYASVTVAGTTVFNDSIHGHVELHPFLVKIIDTPQFQRLRNIKQLGGGYLVYPGASHNRFEHSIGVAYLAGVLAKTLQENQPELNITDMDILCVQIGGLCHDLGHGPFSHLFDEMFIRGACGNEDWTHEVVSVRMFEHLMNENELKSDPPLLEDDLMFIRELILGRPLEELGEVGTTGWPYRGRTEEKSFLYEIVSNKENGIDVDKFDYFARDCHHLGIKNNFDHMRYFKFARVIEVGTEPNRRKHICLREKEVWNLYELFHTRLLLHKRVCHHKVTTNVEIMMEQSKTILKRIMTRKLYRFLGEAKVTNINNSPPLITFSYGNEEEDPMKYTYFYKKNEPDRGFLIPRNKVRNVIILPFLRVENKCNSEVLNVYCRFSQVSDFLPECFLEQRIRVYWKTEDEDLMNIVAQTFRTWCNTNGFEVMIRSGMLDLMCLMRIR